MEGMNQVTLLGNLGADPELRGGVLKLRLACTDSYLDKNRDRQEKTEWVNVVVFGKQAEALAGFLTKGRAVFVSGRLQTSSYEKDGQKRYATEVVAIRVIVPDGRGGRQEQRRESFEDPFE